VCKKLNMYEIVLAAWKVNRVLGCFKRGIASRLREFIILLYFAFMQSHLEHCVQTWGSQHMKYMELLEWFQRRVMKVNFFYEER